MFCTFFINQSRHMNIRTVADKQYLQYFVFCINQKSCEKFKSTDSLIDLPKNHKHE